MGEHTGCGRTADGAIQCWGWDTWGLEYVQLHDVVDVAMGDHTICTVHETGMAGCVGVCGHVACNFPDATYVQAEGGQAHTCALTDDGSVICVGCEPQGDNFGQCIPPAGSFTYVAAGAHHSCGLRPDGSLVCWGRNDEGQAAPPLHR